MDFSMQLRQALEQIKSDRENVSEFGKWDDPRKEFKDDAHEWTVMMSLVKEKELYDMLDTFRAIGCRLKPHKNVYKLIPHIDPTGDNGFVDQEQFQKLAANLIPFKGTINAIMMQIAVRCGSR